jgi:glycosyltransferase involved in cell wall biosynthesis
LKICFVARDDLFSKRGGDTILCELYMQLAKNDGYEVTTWTSSSLYIEADLYHAFNIDRPLEIFPRLKMVVSRGKKFVITTLHHPNNWVERFRMEALGSSKKSKLFYSSSLGKTSYRAETIKELVRQIIKGKLEPSTLSHSWLSRIQWILQHADTLLLQSRLEANYIMVDYSVSVEEDVLVTLPNPAMSESPQVASNVKCWDALFVGRIEVRKNPLSLALAAIAAKKNILFIGKANLNEAGYATRFSKLIEENSNLQWIKGVSREELQQYYRQAGVLVNPSYVEVSPIVDIEALSNQCPLVTTKYALHHEFLPSATLSCDPYSIDSIVEVLNMEHKYHGNARIPSESQVAESLMSVYRSML